MKKKLISEELTKELSRKKRLIETRLEAVVTAQKVFKKLNRQREALPLEISELENTSDADDDAAIAKIGALQTKLRIVERQAAEAEVALSEAESALRQVNTTGYFRELFSGQLEQIEEAVAEKLSAVYEPGRARMMARDTDTFRNAAHFLNYECAGMVEAELGAQEALRMINLLLEGKAPGFELLAPATRVTAVIATEHL